MLSSDVVLYHTAGTVGNGVLGWLSARRHRGDRIEIVKSWVEISEERLTANYKTLTKVAGADIAGLAVEKANAYGHSAEVCAPVLVRAGAGWLGVTDAAEGAAVREALAAAGLADAPQPGILVMCGLLAEDAAAIVEHGLTPVVWERQQIEWLAAAVRRRGAEPLAVHLEIDTGMARQGVATGSELRELLRWLAAQKDIHVDGVMTHFASAEVAGSALTRTQRARFGEALRTVREAGLRPAWVHAGNSSTVDNDVADGGSLAWLRGVADSVGARAMVRTGIGLYGYCLPIECAGEADSLLDVQPQVRTRLQPVMTWKTRVIALREIGAGDAVGYNATFVAERPMRLALLPVGYADGLRRELSSTTAHAGGSMMLHGMRAAIVGRVSMNLTVVDVTEIPDVQIGDETVVLGDGTTAEDHARLAGTIAYEIVCGVRASSRLVHAESFAPAQADH
jgi:alanine racemase